MGFFWLKELRVLWPVLPNGDAWHGRCDGKGCWMIWRALGQNKCCYCNYLNLIASFLGYFAEEGYCNGIKK